MRSFLIAGAMGKISKNKASFFVEYENTIIRISDDEVCLIFLGSNIWAKVRRGMLQYAYYA